MNDFFAQYPAVAVLLIGGLVSLVGAMLSLILWLGHRHMMNRFDKIDKSERANIEQHQGIHSTLKEMDKRLVRVETMLRNGHAKKAVS